MKKLRKRVNERGYAEYKDPKTGEWKQTHRQAAENKYGELPPGYHVHHRNQNKQDNRWSNLALVTPSVHAKLHSDPTVCDICGRPGHWRAECYARTDFKGNLLKRKR